MVWLFGSSDQVWGDRADTDADQGWRPGENKTEQIICQGILASYDQCNDEVTLDEVERIGI
jgi:hypothetical protein